MRHVLAAMIFSMSASFFACSAYAGAFEVAPTTITMPSTARSGALYVTNRSEAPVNIQIEAYDWQQEGTDKLTPSNALIVSPPMMRLSPGHKQTVRLAMNPTPDTKEHSFRLMVSELPDGARTPAQGVSVLLQFSVPVFITGAETNPVALQWQIVRTGKEVALSVQNQGAIHAKLDRITLAHENGKIIAVATDRLNYVLTGGTRQWKISGENLTPGETLTLTTQDENDGAISARMLVPN